jgi:hypothetical protein
MSATLFHYTQVYRAVMILRDSMIKRSTGETPPYVWLSSNPTQEPTARAIRPEQLAQMVGDEHALGAFGGWVRFVFDGCEAIPWQGVPLPSAVRGDLERKAEPKGGRPEEWFALDRDVRCTDLPLEIERVFGWQGIAHRDLKRRYADLKVMRDGTIRLGRWRVNPLSASAALGH